MQCSAAGAGVHSPTGRPPPFLLQVHAHYRNAIGPRQEIYLTGCVTSVRAEKRKGLNVYLPRPALAVLLSIRTGRVHLSIYLSIGVFVGSSTASRAEWRHKRSITRYEGSRRRRALGVNKRDNAQ